MIDPNQNYADDLREFTTAFFDYFGAQIDAVDSQPGLLSVSMDGALADHFGRPELLLRFHQSQKDGSELIAFGSRVFDRMVEFLNQHGAVTVLRLPRRHAGGEELLRAIQPTNAGIAGLKMDETVQLRYAFNWHITYRADDKREELFTVLLDADGDYVGSAGNGGDSSAEDEAEHDAVSLETLLADAESVAIEQDETGKLISPNLPPMTRLREYAEIARKYAIYHADLRCITLESEVLPRLHKTLSRLKIYYDQQIEEVYDSHDLDGEKRRVLEEDLERKIAEEVENHRLRVNARLFSYALVEVPTATADITLSDGKRSVEIDVSRNLYDGTLERPECFSCGEQTSLIALDRNGHITCDDCIRQCGSCMEIYCAQCGVAACPVCGRENCDDCSADCWACGERACREHVDRCPVCGDSVCLSCQSQCASCGRRQCRTHLRIDTVSTEKNEENAEPELICPDCAVRCPGCSQFSAHLDLCDASGQRFCKNCLVTCIKCGRQVGVGFYTPHPLTGNPHCNACAMTCNKCGAITVERSGCAICDADCCAKCGQVCRACNRVVCADHAVSMQGCDHVVCVDHVVECCIGSEPLCPVCNTACASCDRHYCADHSDVCTRCRREVCAECVRRSGLCDTCATHDRDGVFVTLRDEPCAQDDRVIHLLPHYRWMRTQNRRFTLYLGRNREMSAALIVAANRPDGTPGDRVLLARRLGILDSKYRERWI